MLHSESSPVLEKPGNGLPPMEAFVSRYILFPLATRLLIKPAQAIEMLVDLGGQALAIANGLPEDALTTRRLIDRFPGIEDSSRYWSVLMTVNHLLITGEAMAEMIEKLAKGEPVSVVVSTADVKPSPDEPVTAILSQYADFLSRYPDRMKALLNYDLSRHRHVHPWFGAITAHQWLCLNGLHHRIHLTQIKKIMAE